MGGTFQHTQWVLVALADAYELSQDETIGDYLRQSLSVVGRFSEGMTHLGLGKLMAMQMRYMPSLLAVLQKNVYSNVLRAQEEQFDGRILGTQLHNPDFVKLAEAYSAVWLRAQGGDQLYTALSTAITSNALTMIEVPVGALKREY